MFTARTSASSQLQPIGHDRPADRTDNAANIGIIQAEHSFVDFLKLPFYDSLCSAWMMPMFAALSVRRPPIVSYGLSCEDADVRAVNIRRDGLQTTYDVVARLGRAAHRDRQPAGHSQCSELAGGHCRSQ